MPRAGLTPERVTALGCAVAEDAGWSGLTLAAVAHRAGVRLPSLYKHVAGLEDLRGRVAARTVAELAEHLERACQGAEGRTALAALARGYRDFALANPGRYPAVVRAPSHPQAVVAAEDLLRTVQRALRGYGLTGTTHVDAVRMVRSAVHGFVSLETAGGFGMPRDVERSFDRLVDGLDAALGAMGEAS